MDFAKKHCIPCEVGTPALTDEKAKRYQSLVTDWELVEHPTKTFMYKLHKQFKFKDFKEAMSFVNKVADLAEKEGHHPDMKIVYNRVTFDLFTHAIGGLSENDFIMAVKIDML